MFANETSIVDLERAYIAQIPVPVPTSRTSLVAVSSDHKLSVIYTCGFLIGAEYKSPSKTRVQKMMAASC
jgi:hypothetical protein